MDITGTAVLETYEFLINKVILREEGKRYQDALDLWNEAQEKYPDYAIVYGHKGVLLYKMGRRKEAVKVLEIAVQSEVKMADSYYYLAKCYLEDGVGSSGKGKDVVKNLFSATLRLEPKHSKAAIELAVIK